VQEKIKMTAHWDETNARPFFLFVPKLHLQ